MSDLTLLIKNGIYAQYKSVSLFAKAVGIPASTINSALSKGIENSRFEMVLKMAKALHISKEELMTVLY